MHILVLIAVSVCLLEKAVTVGAQTCYFPDGSVSGRDIPCRAPSSDQASACCDFTAVCLDNNLCLDQEGNEIVTRGTCTDQQWQSADCPQFCQDGMSPNVRLRKVGRSLFFNTLLFCSPSRLRL